LKLYDIYEEPTEKQVGECICEMCGAVGKLMLREGKQFHYWYCKCPNHHRPMIKEKIDDIFQIGDRIRYYHIPFGKNSKIDLTTYEEGLIIDKHEAITGYLLDMRIDKAVFKNKPVIKTSWLYGYVIKGIDSDSNALELLTPQMKMII
jgi:hypothetical protein